MGWLKRFIINVVLENITVSVGSDGKPELEWKMRKTF